MPTAGQATSRHWLLPQERWSCHLMELGRARLAADLPGPQRLRFQRNYGPDGEVFPEAATGDLVAGAILGVGGVVLASVTTREIPATTGSWLAVVGILTVALAW